MATNQRLIPRRNGWQVELTILPATIYPTYRAAHKALRELRKNMDQPIREKTKGEQVTETGQAVMLELLGKIRDLKPRMRQCPLFGVWQATHNGRTAHAHDPRDAYEWVTRKAKP